MFLLAICFSAFIGISGIALAADHPVTVETVIEEYQRNVNRSIELYEQVLNPYITEMTTHNGKEFNVYSNDFGGSFIDEQGLLNIGIVANDFQIKQKQAALRYNGQVVYVQFTYSYNFLQAMMNSVENIMDQYNILAVGIDDLYNHVFIELNDEKNVVKIISHLQKENLYEPAAINIVADPNVSGQQDANKARGGESLSGGGSRGTTCVNAIDSATGQLGILTNEHVAPMGTSMNYRELYNAASNTHSMNIAMGTTLRAQNSGSVDAANRVEGVETAKHPFGARAARHKTRHFLRYTLHKKPPCSNVNRAVFVCSYYPRRKPQGIRIPHF